MASWPPLPGHLLDAGRQPVSVVVPSVSLKLYLEILNKDNRRCCKGHLLLVKHNAPSGTICKPSLQLRDAGWDRSGSTSTSSGPGREAFWLADYGGSVHSGDSSTSECKS